jgi:signal transduction histidine kinase
MKSRYLLKKIVTDKYAQQTIRLRSLYVFFGGAFNVIYFFLFDKTLVHNDAQFQHIAIVRFSVFIGLTIIAVLMNVRKFEKYAQVIIFPAGLIVGSAVLFLTQLDHPIIFYHNTYIAELILVLCLCPLVAELTPFLTACQLSILLILYNCFIVPQFEKKDIDVAINGNLLIFICVFYVTLVRVYLQRLTAQLKLSKVMIEREKLNHERKNIELLELDSFKTKILSILSHDIRSPLSNIQALLTIKKQFHDVVDTADYDNKIEQAAESTLQLLNNILEWSGAQMKGITVSITPVKIHNVTNEVIKLFSAAAERKGLMLINKVSPDTMIHSDRSIIQLLLRNLISNAIKFTKQGSISIGCNITKQDCEIYVRDTGLGFDDTVFKLDKSDIKSLPGTNDEKGSGFGLLLCNDYLERINGRLSFKSKKNEGTTFYIFIPSNKNVLKPEPDIKPIHSYAL